VSQTGKAIRSLLVADATLTGIVSTRIREGKLGQSDSYPAVVFNQVASTPNHHKLGTSEADNELYQVTCIADNYSDVYDISDSVRGVLDGVHSQTVAGVEIDGVLFMNEIALPYNDETDLVQVVQDYQIRIKR
jgi:hypothetical protein